MHLIFLFSVFIKHIRIKNRIGESKTFYFMISQLCSKIFVEYILSKNGQNHPVILDL